MTSANHPGCGLLTHLVTRVGVFLLVGWKFGREASGRPLFDFPPGPAPSLAPGAAW
jgi:hypothetical protein